MGLMSLSGYQSACARLLCGKPYDTRTAKCCCEGDGCLFVCHSSCSAREQLRALRSKLCGTWARASSGCDDGRGRMRIHGFGACVLLGKCVSPDHELSSDPSGKPMAVWWLLCSVYKVEIAEISVFTAAKSRRVRVDLLI